jgi:hypothetical protein
MASLFLCVFAVAVPSAALVLKRELREGPYGNAGCPCVGVEGLTGNTTVTINNTQYTNLYPTEIGSKCQAWDEGRFPDFCDNSDVATNKEWCAQSWCYVDPCNCDVDAMGGKHPYMSRLFDGAVYEGKRIFYSYATCEDTESYNQRESFSDEATAMSENYTTVRDAECSKTWDSVTYGDSACPCVGINGLEGYTDVIISNKMYSNLYPADIGTNCSNWDADKYPEKCTKENPESWCNQKWCYVDKNNCAVSTDQSTYLPQGKFQGRNLFYSNATCTDDSLMQVHNHGQPSLNHVEQAQRVVANTANAAQKLKSTSNDKVKALRIDRNHGNMSQKLFKRMRGPNQISLVFQNFIASGAQFALTDDSPITGTLSQVVGNFTFHSGESFTWADDLTIIIANEDLSDIVVQVGGFSDFGASWKFLWGCCSTGTEETDSGSSVDCGSIDVTGYYLWLGNGYGSGGPGDWSGLIDLDGIDYITQTTDSTGGISGDPHVWFNGSRTTIHLPADNYTKLLEQGDVALYAKGGAKEQKSMNHIFTILVVVGGEEAVRVEQLRGLRGKHEALMKVAVDGWSNNFRPGNGKRDLTAALGRLRCNITRERVTVAHESSGLHFTVASRATTLLNATDSHHLNLRFDKGLALSMDSQGIAPATGALPQIWGIEPIAPDVASLIVGRGNRNASKRLAIDEDLELL